MEIACLFTSIGFLIKQKKFFLGGGGVSKYTNVWRCCSLQVYNFPFVVITGENLLQYMYLYIYINTYILFGFFPCR